MFAIKAPVTVSVVASAQAQKCEKKATWVFARISSSLDFELYCLFFLRFVGDERWWNFGRYPRKFRSPKKERVRVRVVSKRANSTHRQRYIHLHPPNVSLQSRVAVRVVRKPARIRDIRDENLFFLSPWLFASNLVSAPKRYAKLRRLYSWGNEGKRNCVLSVCAIPERLLDFFFKLTPLSLSLSLCVCVCVSFINAGSRNKSPPPAPPRSCSSTPPRRRLKSWASRSKTASRTPRRKSLSNRSFRTEDRLSTSRRTGPRMSRLLTGDWRRTWRDRMLGARRLRERRAWTSRVVRRNNLKFVKICDWLTDDGC